MPTRKYRLLTRAQIDVHLREPGEIFELEDGVLGPHKTRIDRHDTIDVLNDSTRWSPKGVDIPLYEPAEWNVGFDERREAWRRSINASSLTRDPAAPPDDPFALGDKLTTFHVAV